MKIGVVGATGLVGQELITILLERGVHADAIVAQARRGVNLRIAGGTPPTEPLDMQQLLSCEVVFLAAPSELARDVAPVLRDNGVTTIDNSSAYRMDDSVPLIVPEVNGNEIAGALIANPNCSTILLVVATGPLHRAFTCTDLRVCTYQAVSGAGRERLAQLREQTLEMLRRAEDGSGPHDPTSTDTLDMAFNVWSHESEIDPLTGMNGEEAKILRETRRILGADIPVSATCIRVPVERAHGEAVSVDFAEPVSLADVRSVLEQAPGIRLVDGSGPSARDATGLDDVLVGRIRADVNKRDADGTSTRFHFWLTGDQLRKGAALNAIQIAEKKGLVFGDRGHVGRAASRIMA